MFLGHYTCPVEQTPVALLVNNMVPAAAAAAGMGRCFDRMEGEAQEGGYIQLMKQQLLRWPHAMCSAQCVGVLQNQGGRE
jgi:hypothetical protein